jgi:hypothetical protein
MVHVVGLAAALGILSAGPALGQEWMELRAIRQVGEETSLRVDVEFAAGELTLHPAAPGDLYDFELLYDADSFEPLREWRRHEGTGHLRVGIDAEELHLKEWKDLDRAPASLELGLGTETPTALEISVGAAESDLDLGGVPLTRLVLQTGASETRLRFDRPNPVRMERMELRVGAADFEVEQLGNARFDAFDFAGGVGDVTLDFSGDWQGEATGQIKLALGSLRLRIPADIGVRITKSTVLTSFEAVGFRKVDDAYESDNWGEASERLELHVDAKFGTVEIERVY